MKKKVDYGKWVIVFSAVFGSLFTALNKNSHMDYEKIDRIEKFQKTIESKLDTLISKRRFIK